MGKRGLGRGLNALIPDAEVEKEPVALPIAQIEPNPFQPRRHFDQQALAELAQSIAEHGLLQPIVVRSAPGGYQLVAGERRLRATKLAGKAEIQAIILELSDRQLAELALIENLQREDLNPLEEAQAYRRLIDEFNLTQETLAHRLGKSRSAIANTLRLLNLAPEVQEMLARGELTAGHARTLLTLPAQEQVAAAGTIADSGMTVRAAEKKRGQTKKRPRPRLDPNLTAVQEQLMEYLGTKVEVEHSQNGGKIVIEFYSQADAQRVLTKIVE